MLNYVLQYCKGPLYVKTRQKEKLIECFTFLRALACKNLAVQTRLIQHMDVLIKAASGELGFQIGKLLREVFSGGPSISLSVNEEHIWRIIQLIFGKGKETHTQRNAALLDALNELLIVSCSYVVHWTPEMWPFLIIIRTLGIVTRVDRLKESIFD